MGKDNNMINEKYYLIFTDDEDIAYYVEENSMEGKLTVEQQHVHFEAADYILDVDHADISKDEDDNIIVCADGYYYTFSANDIESIE